MKIDRQLAPAMIATIAAAIGSSLLIFLILAITGKIGPPTGPDLPLEILVILSIILIWGPAIALIPAGLLGFFVERPLSRRLIARRDRGFAAHLVLMIAAAVLVWLLLRFIAVYIEPRAPFIDYESLAVFLAIGFCSAISWWFIVVVPGRRE